MATPGAGTGTGAVTGEVLPNQANAANPTLTNQPTINPNNILQEILADPRKRVFAFAGLAVFVVLIIVSVWFFSSKEDENRGKLVPLVQELNQPRAFEIIAKLKSMNIEAKVMPSEKPGEYSVQVYENAIESSYLALSRTNLLEDDGYGLFDQNDWAASDYDKRIKLIRAINGDLSRIISRMDGLRSAIVRVNLPEQQLFTEFQSPTTATIQIELENDGDELSKSQVKSMVNVLRGYVPNLDKDKISIVDTQGRNYNTFKTEDEGGTDDFLDELERINKTIQKRIEKYLDVVLGPEKYKVSVSAYLSREKIQKQQTVYSDGAVGSRQVGEEILNAGGTGSNAYGPGIVGGKNYKHGTTNETLLPSFEQQNVTYLPGRVTDVTVALALDKSVPAMISLKQLQESVAAIVSPNTVPEQVKLTVVDLYAGDSEAKSLAKGGQKGFLVGFFDGGLWHGILKIFSILGMVLGLLVVAIIGLNFLNAAANVSKEYDSGLGEGVDEVFGQTGEMGESDYGERAALQQQEELLREMMNPGADISSNYVKKEGSKSFSHAATMDGNVEFDDLMKNFQSVAHNKPDLLAKKIQVWLDEE